MFKLNIFGRKKERKNRRTVLIPVNLPEFLKVDEADYDVYTEVDNDDVAIYRLEFKKPAKLSADEYDNLIHFLWKAYKGMKLAIIEDRKNTVAYDDCYDVKIYIDREEVDGSIYIKNMRFELKR
jgi:hypothetical protein